MGISATTAISETGSYLDRLSTGLFCNLLYPGINDEQGPREEATAWNEFNGGKKIIPVVRNFK